MCQPALPGFQQQITRKIPLWREPRCPSRSSVLWLGKARGKAAAGTPSPGEGQTHTAFASSAFSFLPCSATHPHHHNNVELTGRGQRAQEMTPEHLPGLLSLQTYRLNTQKPLTEGLRQIFIKAPQVGTELLRKSNYSAVWALSIECFGKSGCKSSILLLFH